jgi:hypothetical protein
MQCLPGVTSQSVSPTTTFAWSGLTAMEVPVMGGGATSTYANGGGCSALRSWELAQAWIDAPFPAPASAA